MNALQKQAYYLIRPLIPRTLLVLARQLWIRSRLPASRPVWPVDESCGRAPDGWRGWPDGRRFALILTHDVDTSEGCAQAERLARLDEAHGFRSSFNFVPRRYTIPEGIRQRLSDRGFEIGVHGLRHDGRLYSSRRVFLRRAAAINRYIADWNAAGFRSPSMHHNLAWIHDLNIRYDSSTFDTDPFEVQSDGVGTIFPFWVPPLNGGTGYVELPYTMPQDSTLFVFLRERNIDIWKRKLKWIAEHGGMALVNTHPDYMAFNGAAPGIGRYPAWLYSDLLEHVKSEYDGQYWHVLPREAAAFIAAREEDLP